MIYLNQTSNNLYFREVKSFLHQSLFGLNPFLHFYFLHYSVTFCSVLCVRNVHSNCADETLRREGARSQRAWNGNAWRGSKSGERRSAADDSHDGLKAQMTWGPSPLWEKSRLTSALTWKGCKSRGGRLHFLQCGEQPAKEVRSQSLVAAALLEMIRDAGKDSRTGNFSSDRPRLIRSVLGCPRAASYCAANRLAGGSSWLPLELVRWPGSEKHNCKREEEKSQKQKRKHNT